MKRSALPGLLFAAVAAFAPVPAAAQVRAATDYPARPVRIIIPQAAGGGVDIMARAVAQKLTETWGQQVIVDNRPGANGIIGIEAVAKSKPDGYTLSAAFTSVLTINQHVYKSLPYDTFRDFTPITQTVIEAGFPKVLVTGWAGFLAPAGTPQDIIQKVQRDTARHLQAPELRDRLSALGAEPAGTTPDQFAAFLKSETEKWGRVAKQAGIYHSQ